MGEIPTEEMTRAEGREFDSAQEKAGTAVGNPDGPADAKAQERARVRRQAMAETRAHFEAEAAGVEAWLMTPAFERAVVELSRLAEPVNSAALDGVTDRLGMPEGMRDLLPATLSAIDRLKPISDAQGVLDQIRKFIREKLNPSTRLADAMKKYDDGASWYHATEEGRKTLARIQEDAADPRTKGSF